MSPRSRGESELIMHIIANLSLLCLVNCQVRRHVFYSWCQVRKGIAEEKFLFELPHMSITWSSVVQYHRYTKYNYQSWSFRSCHLTTMEKINPKRIRRLIILLIINEIYGNILFLFVEVNWDLTSSIEKSKKHRTNLSFPTDPFELHSVR